MRYQTLFIMILVSSWLFPGCGRKEEGPPQTLSAQAGDFSDEPTKYASQDGLARLTEQAEKSSHSGVSVLPNPKFLGSRDLRLESKALQDLDAEIRPVLNQLFGAARVTEQNNTPVSDREDDLTLNSMKYIVRQMLTQSNVRQLHAELVNADFKPSIRLGTKPTIVSTWAAMSFYKYIRGTYYSLALKIDFIQQSIRVESYKPGSKYDRVM